jgi:hypothetical protein
MIRQKKYPAIRNKLRRGGCGRQATSPGAVEAHPSPSFANTLSSNRLQAEDSFAGHAPHPRPKERGFPHHFDKTLMMHVFGPDPARKASISCTLKVKSHPLSPT